MKNTFIKTKDSDTAEQLRKYLNELPSSSDGFFVFVNDPTVMNFEEKYKDKDCIFTNKLNF